MDPSPGVPGTDPASNFTQNTPKPGISPPHKQTRNRAQIKEYRMNQLLKALRPLGTRRGPRRPRVPSLAPQGERRAPRGNWVTGEPGPEADALAIDILLGYDPRRFL